MFSLLTLALLSLSLYVLYQLVQFFYLTPKFYYDTYVKQGAFATKAFTPVVGDLPDMLQRRKNPKFDFIDMLCELQMRCSPNLTRVFQLGPVMRLFMSDPDHVQCILKTHAQYYDKSYVIKDFLSPLIGLRNLLLLDGVTHQLHRKMINPAFHFANLRSMVDIMVQQTDDALSTWQSQLQARSTDNGEQFLTLDVHREMTGLTLDIIAKCACGSAISNDKGAAEARAMIYEAFTKVLHMIFQRVATLVGFLPIIKHLPFKSKRTISSCAEQVDKLVMQIVTERRAGRSTSLCQGADLLDLLLNAQDPVTGQTFTDAEVHDEMLTFIFAGHETTANLMTWCLYCLSTRPDIVAEARKELDAVLGTAAAPTASQLPQLKYIEAILNETLRLFPPAAAIDRQVNADHEIGGDEKKFFLPKGALVIMPIAVLHRDPTYWKEPEVFDPTRFLKEHAAEHPKRHAYSFMPFSMGPRSCIGQNFAMEEAKIMLAMMLQRFDLELMPGQNVRTELMITLRPKHELLIKFKPRRAGAQ